MDGVKNKFKIILIGLADGQDIQRSTFGYGRRIREKKQFEISPWFLTSTTGLGTGLNH